MRRLLALTLLLLAPGLHAETYKWVDERGVVNYSNTPPPAAAKAAQQITDRVSTYQTDPGLRQVAAATVPSGYEMMQQQEWLQRQRLMHEAGLMKASSAQEPIDYGDWRYAYPAFGYSTAFANRRSNVKRVNPLPRNGVNVGFHNGRRF